MMKSLIRTEQASPVNSLTTYAIETTNLTVTHEFIGYQMTKKK